MLKLIQMLTKKKLIQRFILYSLPLGRRVVSLTSLGVTAILHSIRHIVVEYVVKINN